MYFLIIKINNFRGDLIDISAKTAKPLHMLFVMAAHASKNQGALQQWLMDSGAAWYMCNYASLFVSTKSLPYLGVRVRYGKEQFISLLLSLVPVTIFSSCH